MCLNTKSQIKLNLILHRHNRVLVFVVDRTSYAQLFDRRESVRKYIKLYFFCQEKLKSCLIKLINFSNKLQEAEYSLYISCMGSFSDQL